MAFANFLSKACGVEHKSVRALTAWLEELPLFDLPKTTVQLNDSLFHLQSLSLKPRDTLERLIHYYDHIVKLSDLSYQRFIEHDDDRQEVHRAELFLVREMLVNYGHALYECAFDVKSHKLSDEQKFKAYCYAMCAYAYAILRTYQLSLFVPTGVWQNLYKLYININKLQEPRGDKPFELAEQMFCQPPLTPFYVALLLAMINPDQSESFELEEAFHFFQSHANGLRLLKDDNNLSAYCLRLSNDKPPVLKRFVSDSDEQMLYLDITKIYDFLNKRTHKLSISLEKKLLDIWRNQGERSSERKQTDGMVDVVDGFSTAYQCIADNTLQIKADVNQLHAKPLSLLQTEEEIVVQYYYEYIALEHSADRIRNMVMKCELENTSENGIALVSHLNSSFQRLDVGQFIAMQGMDENDWVSGLIRWITLSETRAIKIGVQLIANKHRPVTIQSDKQRQMGYQTLGLLAESTYPGWPGQVLLTPVYSYHANEKVTVLMDGEAVVIVLKECVERASRCLIFTFDIM